MKKMLIFPLMLAAVSVLITSTVAQAQTGTRVGGMSTRQDVIWFSEPSEIAQIRHLMQVGKGEEAVRTARNFVERLRNMNPPDALVQRYFALTALCSALTQTQELEEAIANCTDAVELFPSRWQALNNRGTAHYVGGNYAAALADYQRAYELEKDNASQARQMIQHNIDLATQRLPTDR
ncbi:MAG: tetratricopeptide repeat protein [Gammaproteobacteria bacterium]|nr:tetratricopeptide repeat protein [Gammaproteobacteria bacterium]